MVQGTSAPGLANTSAHLPLEVAREMAVLQKHKEVAEQQGEMAVALLKASGIGQLLDIRV